MLLTSYTIVLTEGSLIIVWVNVVFFKNCCSSKCIWSDIYLTTIKSKPNAIGIKNSKMDDILFLLNRIKFLVVSALNCCIKYYKQNQSSKDILTSYFLTWILDLHIIHPSYHFYANWNK